VTRIQRLSRSLAWLFISATVASGVFAATIERTGGPYVPTPEAVVDHMLRIGNVSEKDYVIDLGSGDGVIVLTAARLYKASGMGIEIDPALVKLSNDSAKKFGIADRVRFVEQDVFKTDLSRATVVTLYLLPAMMLNLRSKIFNELQPDVRVVSHDYHFGEWRPDDSVSFDVPEKEKITGIPSATVYIWHVPAKIAGTLSIKVAGADTYDLNVKQRFQVIDATAITSGKPVRVQYASLRGNDFTMAVPDGKGVARYTGRVNGDSIEGSVDFAGNKPAARWTATRTLPGSVVIE